MAELNRTTSTPDGGTYDVIIIGAGPAGLFASFYAGLRGMRTCLLDAAPQLGGQVAALYPEKWIYDVGGFPKVRGQDLVKHLVDQGTRFTPDVQLNTQVRELTEKGDNTYAVGLSTGETLLARGVIIAAGLGSFRPKPLPVPDIDQWEGRGLTYSVGHLADLSGKRVVIVGGGDTAVDWALMVSSAGADVTLVHRRDEFRAVEESVEALKRSPVHLKLSAEVAGVEGDGALERVRIQKKPSGEIELLDTDVLLGCLGYQAELGPISGWGLEMDRNTIRTDHMGRTSRPRVYAVGDIASYPGKLKLIATAFGEAAMAVSHLKTQIDSKASLQGMHSSGLKLEG